MKIYKNGEKMYDSIDNTGTADNASLSARYAKGRLDSLDNRFDDYVSNEDMSTLLEDEIVNRSNFVTSPTGRDKGIEVVLPQEPRESSEVVSDIDDSAEMKYSTVHTSSNNYINTKLDALSDSLVGKMNLQFISALPTSPERNTQYYVETETAGTWDIYIVDNTGTVHDAGSTQVDFTGVVRDTRKIAGLSLSADITAQQLDNSIKDLTMSTKQDSLTAEAVSTVSGSTKVSGIDLTANKSLDTTVESIGNYLINKIFPIGSLYTTTSNDNPADILGIGTWEIVATNRVLWGVDASTTAGSTLSEQLPNIKGEAATGYAGWAGYKQVKDGTGVFDTDSTSSRAVKQGYASANSAETDARNQPFLMFDASRSSSVYKDGASVRPAAYTAHIWKRTA